MKKICSLCNGSGKLGFQREDCCCCFGTGFIGKDIPKVFIKGISNKSIWKNELVNIRKNDITNIEYIEKLEDKRNCDYFLHIITPRLVDISHIAEIIDDSNKKPSKTIFCILDKDTNPMLDNSFNTKNLPAHINYINFTYEQLKHLNEIGDIVKNNGGKFLKSVSELNKLFAK